MVAYEKGACDTVLFMCKERLHVLDGCFREGLHVRELCCLAVCGTNIFAASTLAYFAE